MLLSMCLISLFLTHSLGISISSSPPSPTLSSSIAPASFASPTIAHQSTNQTGSRTERTMQKLNCTAKAIECDESKARAVCGTDGQTYTTRCHLMRAQCAGHKVHLKHRGSCKECLETRTYAIAHRSSTHKKFVPRCRSDGTYAAVQCMGGAGCWCSDGQGKPIPNTTTTSGKPVCPKISKVNIRRSPPGQMQSVRRSRNRNRICRRNDQRAFNSNLLKSFYGEYSRTHPMDSVPTDKIVLDWKFNQLDGNKDDQIHKTELREMRRLVRKALKPKRCARLFGRQLVCDSDFDEKLSRLEWVNCLTKDKFISDHGKGLQTDDYDDSDEDDYDSNNNHDDRSSDRKSFPFFTPVTPYPPVYLLRSKAIAENDPVLREAETESDCLTDRAAALDEQKDGAQAWYVPECTADGRYQRIQCYRSVGYCWCVNEDTGKNIPGTSIKDGRPDCAISLSRPMKGCPEPRKLEFLKELKEFLRIQIATTTGANVTNWTSEDERVATLSFVLIDKNKNKVWERKEWKIFRELVAVASVLKKCGKKMPRYCDVNNDKRITLPEWLNCLQVQTNVQKTKASEMNQQRPTQSALKLKGPNPLESYLKSD